MTPQEFIDKWDGKDGSERANYQLFLNDLCELLEVDKPQPSMADDWENAYVFERYIEANDGTSAGTSRFIDTYRRGHFICESKSFNERKKNETEDRRLIKARNQAESYARNLPTSEPRPLFLVVINVGRFIALYAQFRQDDRSYMLFPDRSSYKFSIRDLAREEIRDRLRKVWQEPAALNPDLISAEVTRAVATPLGRLARELEEAGHPPQNVAGFLTRCLFSMFAEDVGLLPAGVFTQLLARQMETPELLDANLEELWRVMDKGGVSIALQTKVAHFNGKLFKKPEALPLTRPQIEILLGAARQDWRHVEPAIFGTLIERALDPEERHALGAHFTPRAYVERLVLPTVIEPLRERWENVRNAAVSLEDGNDHKGAVALVREFYGTLCQARVLDPACGSGNFLYIALEYMKRLEGEVLEQLGALGVTETLDTQGLTVDPHQFIGLELNPRAAAVAELVLWIGYLQWHFRTRGKASPPSPVLKDFKNILTGDAVLRWDAMETVRDGAGQPVTRWDGKTLKRHPVTGQDVPDESARVDQMRYLNPQTVDWPEAAFVVGNPPFIGNKRMRDLLGDGYVEALRAAHADVPDSADLVMYWWDQAARLLAAGKIQRFGFITTNSLTQVFNRRVLEAHQGKLSLAFAIPDHPWVDSADGAAVRVAMTVAVPGEEPGRLLTVTTETPAAEGEVNVTLLERRGHIHADLKIGANVAAAQPLKANAGLSNRGVIPHGEGFLVTPEQGAFLDGGALLKPYRNGKDLTDRSRGLMAIDTFGLDEAGLRAGYPASWQWLHDRVKPARDQNPRKSRREKWWLFAENQPRMRVSVEALTRFIVTGYVAKHRTFQFAEESLLPDDGLVAIALDDRFALGVLSSQVHIVWALAAGGRLGVGNDPRYNNTRCFQSFPFPEATPEQRDRIGKLAEEIDAHRKKVLAAHAELTLTGLYNVVEALRAGRVLTAKEKTTHTLGLVSLLKTLHDQLDAAVLAAYGWQDLVGPASAGQPDAQGGLKPAPQEIILERLVALNRQRQAEEAAGTVRWLRPEFQATRVAPVEIKAEEGKNGELPLENEMPASSQKQAWPADQPTQFGLVTQLLKHATTPLSAKDISARFSGDGSRKDVPPILATLESLAKARQIEPGRYVIL